MRSMKGGVVDRRGEPSSAGGFPGLGGGGGGGLPIPVGKGAIGLVIVIVLMFLGGSQIFGGGGSGVPGLDGFSDAGTATTQGDTIDPTDPTGRFVAAVIDDVQYTWNDIFERSGKTYEPTQVVLFTGSTNTGCGQASSATGPFYCPADRLVYLDTSFFKELERRFGAPGDFAQAYVIAHEVGHHIQTLLGIEADVRRLQQEDPSRTNELSVRMELQADCFAGVWGRAAQAAGILEPGDVEEGLNAAAQIGDDRIQASVDGRVDPESFTHGTAEQRSTWLRTGIQVGNPDACDTFSNDI
ncbi:MAG: neutral zinc metallopeptidase [Actinomycetota bacterium]